MPRFTISHHTGGKEGDHYDLFLEEGDHLRTWRLERPTFDEPQEAVEIAPHRKRYLDYEGEIPDGRGRVRIVETGTCHPLDSETDRISLRITGRRGEDTLELRRSEEAQGLWYVTRTG